MKILIVDDETLPLFIAKKLLAIEYEVEGFTTSTEAIQWAKSNEYDILVSDYYLDNNLNAADLLKELQAIRGKNFKAYVLTNFIDDKIKEELIQLGFNGILEKPLTLEKFKSGTGL